MNGEYGRCGKCGRKYIPPFNDNTGLCQDCRKKYTATKMPGFQMKRRPF